MPETTPIRAPRRQKRTYKPAEERKQEILDCALSAFAERGYHATSIGDVCERAGIGRATLYQYFEDKQALLRALTERVVTRVTTAYESRPRVAIPPGVKPTTDELIRFSEFRLARVLAVVFENADIARLVLRVGRGADGIIDEILARLDRLMLTTLEDELGIAIQAGVIRPIDTAFAARFFLGGCEKVVMSYIEEGRPIDAQTIAREVAKLQVLGIAAQKGTQE